MVDLQFDKRLTHFVPLKLLQAIAEAPVEALPSCLTPEDATAIKNMALLSRGRLSVQPVSDQAYEAIVKLGEQGDFDELLASKKKAAKPKKPKTEPAEEGSSEGLPASTKKAARQRKRKSEAREEEGSADAEVEAPAAKRRLTRGIGVKSYKEDAGEEAEGPSE
jgi:hypothetical protein